MSTVGWIVLAVVNIPLYWLIGWAFFKDWGDFCECVKYSLTPDVISLFRGEWNEDRWAQLKLGLWTLACAGAVYGEGAALAKWLH